MFRAMIVGCGNIAGIDSASDRGTHAGAIGSEPRIELVASVDCSKEKAIKFADQHKCKAFNDLNFALDEMGPDIVSICTPDSTHFQIAKTTLLANRPPKVIFLEKPACFLECEYKELVRLAIASNVMVVVNHSRRFNPKYLELRNIIHSGSLGLLNRVNATYYSGWFHNGTHIIDTLTYLLEDEINWRYIDDVHPSPYLNDETLELTGYLIKSNAKVVISAIDEALYQLFEFDFWFQEGRLRIEDFGNDVHLYLRAVNDLGEHVLRDVNLVLPKAEHTELQVAITSICDFLERKNLRALGSVSLEAISVTMESLWQAKNLCIKKRREINDN